MKLNQLAAIAASLVVASGAALADNVLIINGASNTSEPSTTDSITRNWVPTCGTGHTVTVVDTPPGQPCGLSANLGFALF